jgi:hypothetical protein
MHSAGLGQNHLENYFLQRGYAAGVKYLYSFFAYFSISKLGLTTGVCATGVKC